MGLSHLTTLEGEAIHIIRDGFAEADNPVVLFSAGNDSTVLAHLVKRAFYPSAPPIPLLRVDSTWEFSDVLAFRDAFARKHGFRLVVFANEEGRRQGLTPFDHGDCYTSEMRTTALKQALNAGDYDVVLGGARRDEEASRAKERIVSVRSEKHSWDPNNQRPELWNCYNWRRSPGQSLRVYPLSNWTEHDLWTYILARAIELAPLYFARERLVAERDGMRIVVDDPDRMRWRSGETAIKEKVRFRTLGCWPVTAAQQPNAADLTSVVLETLRARTSERLGRISDSGSREAQKREGYF